MSADSPLLEVRDLRVSVATDQGSVPLVSSLSFQLQRGSVLGLTGESGSGKTVSLLALLGLLPEEVHVEGEALFEGKNIISFNERALREIRGKQIGVVFQDPFMSLHPMLRIDSQLCEHVRWHLGMDKKQARARAIELLDTVRIPDPESAMRAFPHQFSGGMRQRIAIAIALACGPKLLIADEPTTDLDVTIQAGILRLLKRLQGELGLSVIIVTHDLGVMAALTDEVIVLYSGREAEASTTRNILHHPRHPYTEALIRSLPSHGEQRSAFRPIVGSPPRPGSLPSGCAFHPRCEYAVDACRVEVPTLREVTQGWRLACDVDPLQRANS